MATVNITIKERIATVPAGVELVCNNPTDVISFEFDAEWSAHNVKTARFSWDGKYIDVVFDGNMVKTPEIYQTNYVYVGVFADNITSTPVKVPTRYSIKCLGGAPEAPASDVYAQLIELINELQKNGVSDAQIAAAVDKYLAENPVEAGATAEQAAQINKNAADIAELKESGGTAGEDGASAYEIALEHGFEGSETEWLESLKGEDGAQGIQGESGEDGISPSVTITEITDGHRVTITDASGAYSFDVMDGADGADGTGGDGSGDMLKSVYDSDGSGTVDDAEKLGGKLPSEYASANHSHEDYAAADHTHDEYLTEYEETDPTVPAWAKAPSKPTYSADEVGASPEDHTHDEYLTEYTETDPTVPDWAKASSKPTYTASEVGLGNVANERQYSEDNPPPYPVTSVNGKTGDVLIDVSSSGYQYSSIATNTGKRWVDGKPIYAVGLQGDGNWATAGQWIEPFGAVSTFPVWFDDIDVFISCKILIYAVNSNGTPILFDVSNTAEIRKDIVAFATAAGRIPVYRAVMIYEFTLAD